MARSASRPGRVALVLTLIVLAILAAVDLSSPRSLLKGLWRAAFPSATHGERVRDNVIEGLRPRR